MKVGDIVTMFDVSYSMILKDGRFVNTRNGSGLSGMNHGLEKLKFRVVGFGTFPFDPGVSGCGSANDAMLQDVASGTYYVSHQRFLRNYIEPPTIAQEIMAEYERATKIHGPMNGPHEAYAVIKEEFDEFWDEVKAKNLDKVKARKELIQVAAMCARAIHDLKL